MHLSFNYTKSKFGSQIFSLLLDSSFRKENLLGNLLKPKCVKQFGKEMFKTATVEIIKLQAKFTQSKPQRHQFDLVFFLLHLNIYFYTKVESRTVSQVVYFVLLTPLFLPEIAIFSMLR